jgi:Amt family ammonium transporter
MEARKLGLKIIFTFVLLSLLAGPVLAEGAAVDSGDTAWILVSTGLVLLMIPGVAFFYGGLVRSKNVLSTLMMVLGVLAIVSIQWVLFGYTLAFGSDVSGFIGDLSNIGLSGVNMVPLDISPSIPGLAFMMFQGMFAIITPTLFVSAFVERGKFSTYLVFVILWTTLVYDPVAHWIWGGGWLGSLEP